MRLPLPPIQRTAGAMPLVAAPGTFAGTLPGSQGLPPIVQPLGHEVSSLATPGLVVARARPVEHSASGALPAPLQRQASRGSRTPSAAAPAPRHAGPETFVMAEAAVAFVWCGRAGRPGRRPRRARARRSGRCPPSRGWRSTCRTVRSPRRPSPRDRRPSSVLPYRLPTPVRTPFQRRRVGCAASRPRSGRARAS